MQPADAASRAVLDRYRLVRRLGAGGFGTVWLAHDLRLDRLVAVKRIPAGDAEQAERARREALAAARLAHPAIVALYEAGADEEACYLVCELVRGRTLGALQAAGELSDREVLEIGVALCDALAHAHAHGVVHRDVKPANVLVPDAVEEGGRPAKLADFGIARVVGDDALTRTGQVVGTLAYMAPEQAEGAGATPASDLYSLALVLFEALSGVNPVRGATPAETARRVGRPVPALGRLRRDLPRRLCAALDAALATEPRQRGSLGELRGALAGAIGLVGDEPGLVVEPGLAGLTRRWWRGEQGHRDEAGPVRTARLAPGSLAPPPRRLTPLRPPADPDPARRTPPSARPRRARLPARLGAALGAGALVGTALATLGAPDPPLSPPAVGALAALAALLVPGLAWLAGASLLAGWLAGDGRAGVALLLAPAVLAVPIALRRRPTAWSLPAAAPALGLLGLATAFPALAGRAATLPRRLALGALGALWLVLVEPLAGVTLLAGPAASPPGGEAWRADPGATLARVLLPAFDARLAALAVAFALAAAVLPWVVAGRGGLVDALLAVAWAAALAAGTRALVAPAEPRGLLAGAAAGAGLALAGRALPRPHGPAPRAALA